MNSANNFLISGDERRYSGSPYSVALMSLMFFLLVFLFFFFSLHRKSYSFSYPVGQMSKPLKHQRKMPQKIDLQVSLIPMSYRGSGVLFADSRRRSGKVVSFEQVQWEDRCWFGWFGCRFIARRETLIRLLFSFSFIDYFFLFLFNCS